MQKLRNYPTVEIAPPYKQFFIEVGMAVPKSTQTRAASESTDIIPTSFRWHVATYTVASSPGPLKIEREKRGPGTHCLRMRQSVPKILVHRILP